MSWRYSVRLHLLKFEPLAILDILSGEGEIEVGAFAAGLEK